MNENKQKEDGVGQYLKKCSQIIRGFVPMCNSKIAIVI